VSPIKPLSPQSSLKHHTPSILTRAQSSTHPQSSHALQSSHSLNPRTPLNPHAPSIFARPQSSRTLNPPTPSILTRPQSSHAPRLSKGLDPPFAIQSYRTTNSEDYKAVQERVLQSHRDILHYSGRACHNHYVSLVHYCTHLSSSTCKGTGAVEIYSLTS
jgi:hypothetical protein